jgi:hypothetical protein
VASTDLLTLSEAKAALNVDSDALGSTQDVELAAYVAAVSARLDELLGPVVTRTETVRLDGGACFVQLRAPVASVTSVVEYDQGEATALDEETLTELPDDGWLLEEDTGVLWRRKSGRDAAFPAGRRNVAVTYTAGRAAQTAVPPRFKVAAALCLAHLWRREQGMGSVTYGEAAVVASPVPAWAVPRAVLELLADELLPPQGVA